MPTSNDEKKPVVVITGISRGFGRALAHEFARRGYSVFGCATSSGCNPPLVHESICFTGGVDVSCDDQVRSWAEKVLARAEAPQILINNAGIVDDYHPNPLWDMPEGEFSRVIDVNLKGAANVIRHFSKAMCGARRGIIVNISSRWSWGKESHLVLGVGKSGGDSGASMWAYCASKGGLEVLTRAIEYDLNPYKVHAFVLPLELTRTDMLEKRFPHRMRYAHPPEESAVYVIKQILDEMKKPIQDLSAQAGKSTDQQ